MKKTNLLKFLQVRSKDLLLLILLLAISCGLLFYRSSLQDHAIQELLKENQQFFTRMDMVSSQLNKKIDCINQHDLEMALAQMKDDVEKGIEIGRIQDQLSSGRILDSLNTDPRLRYPYALVTIDVLHQTGYWMVQNDNGSFYVGVKDVNPYLKGYQLSLVIGNPQSCTYGKGTATLYWAPEGLDEAVTANERRNAIRRGESFPIELNSAIRAGKWNTYTCYIPGLVEEDLAALSISLDVDGISLQ